MALECKYTLWGIYILKPCQTTPIDFTLWTYKFIQAHVDVHVCVYRYVFVPYEPRKLFECCCFFYLESYMVQAGDLQSLFLLALLSLFPLHSISLSPELISESNPHSALSNFEISPCLLLLTDHIFHLLKCINQSSS